MGPYWAIGVVVAALLIGWMLPGVIVKVPSGERRVIERFSRYRRTMLPGWRLRLPLVESVVAEVPVGQQVVTWYRSHADRWQSPMTFTADYELVEVRATLRFTVTDLLKAAYGIPVGSINVRFAVNRLASERVRQLIHALDAEELTAQTGEVQAQLLASMTQAVSEWGIVFDDVEIAEIVPAEPPRGQLPAPSTMDAPVASQVDQSDTAWWSLHAEAADLRAEQAGALLKPATSTARLRLGQVAITVLAITATVALLWVSFSETFICTEAAPCLPEPLSYIGLGALVASCFVAWIDMWVAAFAVSVFAVTTMLLVPPGTSFSAYAMFWGYAALVLLIAWIAQRPVRNKAALAWRAATAKQPIPAMRDKIGEPGTFWRPVLLGSAVILAAIGFWQQDQADRRTARASIVSATVHSHVSGSEIVLQQADASLVNVSVLSAANYPVGSSVRIKSDERGLARPLAEPEDASGWLLPASLLGIGGVALQLRRSLRKRALQRLLDSPQPVSKVWYGPGSHAIFATDVNEGDWAIGAFTEPYQLRLANSDTIPSSTPMTPGVLFGVPALGSVAAVVPKDGYTVIVGRLAKPPFEKRWPYKPYMLPTLLARVDAPDEVQRDAVRYQRPQVHRFSSEKAFAGAVVLSSMLTLLIVGWISPLDPVGVWLTSGMVTAAFIIFWWWFVVRPVMLWNDGGVTIVDHRGVHTFPWSEVFGIDDGWGTVHVTTYDGRRASITSGDSSGWEPARAMSDTMDLSGQLKEARRSHDPSIIPPPPQARPYTWIVLPLAFAFVTIGVALFTQL